MGKLTGRLTEFLGRWTNDRKTEAQGRVEQKEPEAPEQAVRQEKEQVRREHGDVTR